MSAAALLDAVVRDVDGDDTTLRRYLHEGALVVVFLRHFG